jgi:hypothetical protein
MGTLLRRFLVLAALMFWQGGFTFYAAVVVPIGQQVLGSHLNQGFITRQVTNYLNLAGAVCLLPLAWDAAAAVDGLRWRRRLRWLTLLALVLTLAFLVWLHFRLDDLLDTENTLILDYRTFRRDHRWYLWMSTVQWGFAVGYALLSLWAWRDEDHAMRERGET